MKNTPAFLIFGLICCIITLAAYKLFDFDTKEVVIKQVPSAQMVLTSSSKADVLPADFTQAAEVSTPAVVHIKSTFTIKASREYPEIPKELRDFFGDDFFFYRPDPNGSQETEAAGSGVIISADGYIITNNHVIENADAIEVVLADKRTYKAKVIGNDPSTDLALLKVEAKNLPHFVMGNSDEVKIGEWVLAVGNPFNLTSTVTAGIVSAKGRNIHILQDNYAIESYIQTDAAVNPGNSGGALVNIKGELIGVNTAIATPTGTYAGYAFAAPVGIVRKVAEDLIKYGAVQRGYLGVVIRDIDNELAQNLKIDFYNGVYVDSLMDGGAAQASGIMQGDIILEINDQEVKTSAQLQEIIGKSKPGEKVNVMVFRNGKEKEIDVELRNREGNKKLILKKPEAEINKVLGASFDDLSKEEKKRLGIESGVKVTRLVAGKIKSFTDMQEGFIITKVNGEPVNTEKELLRILENRKGGVMFEGIYPGVEEVFYYALGL